MPKVLIKADDLRLDLMSDGWRKFLSFCTSEKIHVNAGVIGSWPKGNGDEKEKEVRAKAMFDELASHECCSIWNHGYNHQRDKAAGISDFRGASLSAQISALRATQDRVEALSGIRMNAFGPPFNWWDQNTIIALQHVTDIRYLFYIPYVPGVICYNNELFVECEPFQTKVVKPGAKRMFSLDEAKKKSKRFIDIERNLVLQVHPNSWLDGALQHFEEYIHYLRGHGYETSGIEDFSVTGRELDSAST